MGVDDNEVPMKLEDHTTYDISVDFSEGVVLVFITMIIGRMRFF